MKKDETNVYPRKLTQLEQYIIDTFHKLFNPSSSIFIYPYIPTQVLSKAKSCYLDIKPDELLIAIFDNSEGAPNIRKGYAFTTQHVYWKNELERPKVAEYRSLGGQFRFGETLIQSLKKLDLGDNRKINVPNYKENRNLFIEFLNKASAAYKEGVPADTAYTPKSYWFLTKDQKRMGPYNLKTLQKNPTLISEKIHLVWREGLTTWLPVSQVPEFASLVSTHEPVKKH